MIKHKKRPKKNKRRSTYPKNINSTRSLNHKESHRGIIITIIFSVLGLALAIFIYYQQEKHSDERVFISAAHQLRPELKIVPKVKIDSVWYNNKGVNLPHKDSLFTDVVGTYGVCLKIYVTNVGRGTATFLDSWYGCSDNDFVFREIMKNDTLRPLAVKKSKSVKLVFPITSLLVGDTLESTAIFDTLCIEKSKTKLQFYFCYYSDFKLVYDLYYWALYRPDILWFNTNAAEIKNIWFKIHGGGMKFIDDRYNPEFYDEETAKKILIDYGVENQ